MIIHQVGNSQGNYHYNAYIYSDYNWYSHFHACYELIYALKGTTKISLNGIDDVLYEGELILISPYSVHSLEMSKDDRTWIGVFSEDYVRDFAAKNSGNRFGKFRCQPKIEAILKENLFFQGKPSRYMLKGCLYMACGECAENAPVQLHSKSDRFVQLVIDYISRHLSEDISMKSTAESLRYEYHYFSSLFHKCFDTNFKSFINMLRYESACTLLSDKTLDITDVCHKCGFGSIRNFNRVFKEKSGVSPSEYRMRGF